MLTAYVSTEGQIVLPDAVRSRLGIRPGDPLDVEVDGARIVLTPTRASTQVTARIIKDPVTGMPVLTMGPDAPVLTSREVEEMLADFP